MSKDGHIPNEDAITAHFRATGPEGEVAWVRVTNEDTGEVIHLAIPHRRVVDLAAALFGE